MLGKRFRKPNELQQLPRPEEHWLVQRQWARKKFTRTKQHVFMCPITGDIYNLEDAVKAQIHREVTHDKA